MKLSTDISIEDTAQFLEKVYKDHTSHSVFTEVVKSVCTNVHSTSSYIS